jgi:hypothetical protein
MLNIILDSRNIYSILNKKIYDYIEKYFRELHPILVFHNKIEALSFSNYEKYILNDYYKESINKFSKIKLIEKMNYYEMYEINLIILIDRFLQKIKSKDRIDKYIFYYIYSWEKIFQLTQPNIFFSEPVVGLWNYIPFKICKKNKIKYIGIVPTKIKKGFYLSDSLYGYSKEFIDIYNKNSNCKRKKEVKDRINIRNNHNLLLENTFKKPKFFDLLKFNNQIKFLLKKMFYIKKYKGDITYEYNISNYKRNLLRFINIKLYKFLKIFEQKIPNDINYFLFPLHFNPEIALDLWGTYYQNQLDTIKNICKVLPINHYLVVKEHKSFYGFRSIRFYKQLKKNYNLILVDPFINIEYLIKNSKGVITITSTVGLEAALLKKPVIVLGKVYYDCYKNIIKIQNYDELKDILSEINSIKFDEFEYVKLINTIKKFGYEFSWDFTNLNNKEIETLIQAILKFYYKNIYET